VQIDTLIHARWIVPVTPGDPILEHHSLAIQGGRILAILPTTEATTQYQPIAEHQLSRHALIPGLINAHTHASMSLLRGIADDLPLMTWLNEHIWPAERRWVSEEFVHDGTQLALAEMIRSGTTCFNDMYFFPDVTARAVAAAGIRASVGLIVLDFPTVWAANPDEYLRRGLEVHDQFRNHPLIRTAFAPHAPYSVSDAPLQRVGVMADELEIPVHIHLNETRDEVKHSLAQYGERPLARLARLGLLSPSLVAVHMTQPEDAELPAFADSGASVVHAPESNLKLASGFCPVQKLLELGVNLALGTDGAASNDDLDMLGEMRTAALLAKGVNADARALPAHRVLRMATLNGATALGIAEETGSLEPGKSADIVAIDLGQAETQPVYNPVSQIVYAAGREQVSDVWVAGKRLLQNRELTTLDLDGILELAAAWQARIAGEPPNR
jgi:5-methylthioadenosine/S-adenosylhomocysteine deaminase